MVASSPLDCRHLIYHTGDGGQVRAAAIRAPVSHVQLNYLVGTACLYKNNPKFSTVIILLWKLSSIPSHYRHLICAWWIPPWHFPPSDQPCSLQTESVQSEANTGNTSPAVFNSTCSYESHCARVGLATCPFSTKSQSITMTPHFLSWTIFQKSLAVDSMGLWAMMNALCCLYPCKRKMQLMK